MRPPYEITNRILELVSSISELVGEVRAARLIKPPLELRRKNHIKTIQSSLEIEGNTLTLEQVTDLIDNKRVLAPEREIMEVRNAVKLYSMLDDFDVFEQDSLLKAHGILMEGLLNDPGKLRTKAAGIAQGDELAHLAPSAEMVYPLLTELFEYLKNDKDILLIKASVFHYEFEFIHPFADGNGRMGRLWQTMILKEYSPVFEFLPVEGLVKERQQDYYAVLRVADGKGESTVFIEFMLEILKKSLEELLSAGNFSISEDERVEYFRDRIGKTEFSRQDYLRHNKDISTATASRDLKNAVEKGFLDKKGDKRLARYKFKK